MNYEKFKKIINRKTSIIVLDTNVILDLARYSLYSSKNILEIFKECKDLIWIPNQVYKEFNKNKYSVFGQLKKKYQNFEKDLLRVIERSQKNLESVLIKSSKYNYFGRKNLENDLNNKLVELKQIIKSYKNSVGIEYDEITTDSPEIIKDIDNLISYLEKNNRIGNRIRFSEQLKIIREGELRYKYKIPPGYEDINKDGVEKYGDLFVWKEILDLPVEKSVKDIIFITNDIKEDWWSKDSQDNLVVHDKLLSEFKEKNPNVNIEFLTTGMFQNFASKVYDRYDFNVYVDLNRKDVSYVERVKQDISNDIVDSIYNNNYYYLESYVIGSEGIEELDINNCEFNEILDTYEEFTDEIVSITYELEYLINLSCVSFDYWGRDDDTKEVIQSPPIEQEFSGSVIVNVTRLINKDDIEEDSFYINNDKEYTDIEIIEIQIDQDSINKNEEDYDDSYLEEENYNNDYAFICSKCGKGFKDRREDVGGICRDCSFND